MRGRLAAIPPHHDPLCFGCGQTGPGLKLQLPQIEGGDSYCSPVVFREEHQGGPGLVHGGIVGAALDEACGLLATWCRFPAVTARFTIRFRKPVPIKQALEVSARVTGRRGRRLEIAGELRNADEVLAESAGTFLHVPLDHFLATAEGQAARDAWRQRTGVE